MDIIIREQDENYVVNIRYEVKERIGEVFELIATDGGFAKWFPELRIEVIDGKKILVFEMADFREEMKIISYNRNQEISYEWDSARIKFELSDMGSSTRIEFEEVIPKSFSNEYSNAAKDMAGWYVQNSCILELLQNKKLPQDMEELKANSLALISRKIDELRDQ